MKTINVVFEDSEYKKLQEIKDKENLSWHDLLMKLTE